VKNISSSALAGPVSLVIGLQGQVRLFNATGQTCATSPEGQDFINLPLTGEMLSPGAMATVNLEYQNPLNEPITPSTRVLSGPGAR
jgi:hypothetical protein